jgi:hypothetical protein
MLAHVDQPSPWVVTRCHTVPSVSIPVNDRQRRPGRAVPRHVTWRYLSMLELGQRGFNRRGLIDDLASALGCSMADLTGQPYLPPERATADAMATVPSIALAVCACTLRDVPDIPARPVTELARQARQANT